MSLSLHELRLPKGTPGEFFWPGFIYIYILSTSSAHGCLPLLLVCDDDTLISVVRNSDNTGMSSWQSPGGNDSLHLQRRIR